jgi:glycosyltransferase involved in cell wall biosynthesis
MTARAAYPHTRSAMIGSAAQVLPPLVSIGVPVYNAAHYLGQALDSLLGQTLDNFELIISDNASTDDTEALCRDYARRDPRIRYIRQPMNIGAPRNWNAVLQLARGEFFKWASGNDYCAPTLLERCVEALRADPGAVLCFGRTQLVGENGQTLRLYEDDFAVLDDSPADRFMRVRAQLRLNNVQQSVMRRAVLRRTRLDRLYPGGDMALTAELALYGRFLLLPEVLLYRRHGAGTLTSMRSPAEVQRMCNPQARRPLRLVASRFHWDHFMSVARAPISLAEKRRAWADALRRLHWARAELWEELRSLFRPAGHRR